MERILQMPRFLLVADAASVDTDNEMRDKTLRTADFLDTEKYPTISFKSTSFKKQEIITR